MMIACVYTYTHMLCHRLSPEQRRNRKHMEIANTASDSGNRYSIQRENAWLRAYGATPLSVQCCTGSHWSVVQRASVSRAAMPYGARSLVLPYPAG